MHLRINLRSKTLWLQGATGLAWIYSPAVRELYCSHSGVWLLAHCAATTLAYVIQFRSRPAAAPVVVLPGFKKDRGEGT